MTKPKKPKMGFCHICQQHKPQTDACVKLPNRKIICEDCKKNTELKVFKIACFWNASGHFEIPARSLDEAISIAEDPDVPLPKDPDYVPDSFEIDREASEELEGEEL
jgi:hypothetical protein